MSLISIGSRGFGTFGWYPSYTGWTFASNLGQIGYILDDGITGRLVEPGNSEQLENGIFELLNNEKLCKKMGLSARKKVIEHYTWGQHVRRILEKLDVNR